VFYWPNVLVHENEYGIERASTYPKGEVRVSHRGMPSTMLTKSPPRDESSGWRDTLHWWTPIDDENTLQISIDVLHLTGEAARKYQEARDAWYAKGGKVSDPELSERILAGDVRLQDVDERADINMIRVQDDVTQVGQGKIRDRADERLGRSDAYVVLLRQLWTRELRALAEGRPLKQWRLPEDFVLTEGYRDGSDGPRRYG
jgi:5,5'-dehydrodivanillate O-demethylase